MTACKSHAHSSFSKCAELESDQNTLKIFTYLVSIRVTIQNWQELSWMHDTHKHDERS